MIHTNRITTIERLDNSTNGNPKHRISFDMIGTYDTATDYSFCYGIDAHRMEGEMAHYTLSKGGKITDLKLA